MSRGSDAHIATCDTHFIHRVRVVIPTILSAVLMIYNPIQAGLGGSLFIIHIKNYLLRRHARKAWIH
jgi:hypothetical protein